MTFTPDIVIYLLGLAFTFGGIMARIRALEKKVEVHNNVVLEVERAKSCIKTHDNEIKVLQADVKLLQQGRA